MVKEKLLGFLMSSLTHLKIKTQCYYSNNILLKKILIFFWLLFIRAMRILYPLFDSVVMIALTYRCQCKCLHCGSALYKNYSRQELTFAEVIKLIDNCKRLMVRQIYFFGGEPLLVKDIFLLIKYARQKDLSVRMDTNGYLLTEDYVRTLKESGLNILGISLDSPIESEHDGLRGVEGLFRKVLNGIAFCKKYALKCYLSTYATRENLSNGKLKLIIELTNNLGVELRILSPISTGRWESKKEVVLSPTEINVLKSLLKKGTVYWEEKIVDDSRMSLWCSAINKSFFYISAYGDVQPCCFLPLSFGNVREEALEYIVKRMWSSNIFLNNEKVYNDCPINKKIFIEYKDRILTLKNYPLRAEDLIRRNELKEWDSWAQSYEADVEFLLGINDEIILSEVCARDKKVLDVGSGSGRFAKRLVGSAKQVTLLDCSKKMLEIAQKNFADNSEVFFVHADAEDFVLNDKFDIIYVLSLLHHIKDREQFIKRLKLHLAENGKIITLETLGNVGITAKPYFYCKVIKKYGLINCLKIIFLSIFFAPHLKKHLSKETFLRLEEFKKILPDSKTRIINGIFALSVLPK